jgi:hypothetical protein
MSAHEEQRDPAPTRQQTAPTYFVGRRESEAVEIYSVGTSVTRLQSARRYGQASLEWHGSRAARLELSHVLISQLVEEQPLPAIAAGFAVHILSDLPPGPQRPCLNHSHTAVRRPRS